jgi:hypothetical protein
MFLSLKVFVSVAICFLLFSCASPEVKKVLTLKEQIAADTEKAQSLSEDFSRRAQFINLPRAEKFLTKTAIKLAQFSKDFQLQTIEIRIHRDSDPIYARGFSFPGTLISIPYSLLKKVEFENELAAFISYELANVINRHLANRVEADKKYDLKRPVILFGEGSVFDLDQSERAQSIKLGTQMLYYAGYDTRGMASIFQHYANYLGNPVSDSQKKEVEFNIREAQRARNELLPALKPIVRSPEFIQFKKELGRVQK